MTDRPRFIYFDLDDTLLDHREAERKALADLCREQPRLFARFDPAHVHDTYHVHNAELWRRYADGEISKDDLQRLRFERLLEALSVDGADAGAVGDHYLACYARHWTLVEGAREAFLAVADRYPVGVLTNGFSEVQHAKLERFPDLRARLAHLVISDEVGAMKPHPQVFRHAAEAAGLAPEEILYVGDSLRSDVRGGRAAGWRVAWFRGDPAEVADDRGVWCFDAWDQLTYRLRPHPSRGDQTG